MIYVLWHGGHSYAFGSIEEDLEIFPSVSAAKSALRSRERYGYSFRQHFETINREPSDDLTPCVDLSSSMTVYLYDPRESRDPYPDFLLTFGPRGGIKKEVC